jgi:hypothetical protein
MPGGDRTGPLGTGPRTGRGLGYCGSYDSPIRLLVPAGGGEVAGAVDSAGDIDSSGRDKLAGTIPATRRPNRKISWKPSRQMRIGCKVNWKPPRIASKSLRSNVWEAITRRRECSLPKEKT